MSEARDTVIEVENLAVSFVTGRGAVQAVRGVSFAIKRGEIVALVGESGSGKSTTGLALMRLLGQSARATGAIRLNRKIGAKADLLRLSNRAMRGVRGNDIAMVFQEPMSSLDPVYTIGAQMREAMRVHHRVGREEAGRRAVESLTALGLPDPVQCLKRYPHLLSGGMRQRVVIAMGLASQPSLLIADEPTTALDVTIQAQIIDHLKRLQRQTGMAVLFITHNLGLVAEIADRALVMYAGEIVESGPVAELFAAPRMPYTQALLRSIPRLGQKRGGGRIRPIPGNFPSAMAPPSGCAFHPRCGDVVTGRCDTTKPGLEAAQPGHDVRCLRWRELMSVPA